jgi:hypothetical protein
MLRWQILVAAAAGLAVCAGCRTKPLVNAHLESVNAEYRELEDYVYALEDQNDRLLRELENLRGNPATRGSSSPSSQPGRLFRRPDRSEPRDVTPGESMPELTPPQIEPGTPVDVSELNVPTIDIPTSPADTPPRETGKLRLEPPAAELPAPTSNPESAKRLTPQPLQQQPTDRRVTHLFLNPAFTGGNDLDGQSGDDGLLVVLEPRNAANEYIPAAGSVSVVVLDPKRVGDAARIARWDFDAAQLADKFDAGTTRGLNLSLPWPATTPRSEKLHLFVRYVTPDGRNLQSDREIFLRRGEELARVWTPRAAQSHANESQSESAASSPNQPGHAAAPASNLEAVAAPPMTPLGPPSPALPAGPVERTVLPPAWSPYR